MPRETDRLASHPLSAKLSREAWDRIESILARFEDAWRCGETPDLDAYLAIAAPGERRALLVELVHEDLAYRFQAGTAPRVERYLERYSELAGDTALAVELIVAEYELRSRHESDITPDGYLNRFAAYADELRACLGAKPAGAPTVDLAPAAGDAVSAAALLTTDLAGGATPASEASLNRTVPHQPQGVDGAPPVAVDDYEILGELGHGGMGVVYKARHRPLQRLVAFKMIRAGAHASADERARFVREAEAVARLQHPHIVQVYDVGQTQGMPFFALEYVEGGSLDRKLDGTPWPARQAAALVETLARAMHAAHQRGIVHRDLKPANVLLTAEGQPKITDFGLAKQMDSGAGQTQSGAIVGTPSYMAPEQAGGSSKAIGPAADVYALGAILYELLTGRPPFQAETPLDTVLQVLQQEPTRPRTYNRQLDPTLEGICLKCLEKHPPDRYLSAEALAEDLTAYLQGEPVLADSGTRLRLLRLLLRETRHSEVMSRWGLVLLCHAGQVFLLTLAIALLQRLGWNQPWMYRSVFAAGCTSLFVPVWFLRFRSGIPLVPVERQLAQVWCIVATGVVLTAGIKLLMSARGNSWAMLPILLVELGMGFGCTAVILGGSFYVMALLCALLALLPVMAPGVDIIFYGMTFAAGLLIPGRRYSQAGKRQTAHELRKTRDEAPLEIRHARK